MHLCHAEVGFWDLLQGFIAVSACIVHSTMLAISLIVIVYMLVMGGNGVADQIAPAAVAEAITVLFFDFFARYVNASLRLAQLFRMDH